MTLAMVTGLTGALGAVLGLPVPIVAEQGGSTSAAATGPALPQLSLGTSPLPTAGPYHPVYGRHGYGESAARFGAPRGGRIHQGQDVFGKPGTPLVSVRAGRVMAKGNDGGRGNYIAIYSPLDKRSYVYLHMLHPTPLEPGDRVEAGQPIGLLGCTGACWGPHLHFEIHRGRFKRTYDPPAIDPLPHLRRWPQVPTRPRGAGRGQGDREASANAAAGDGA